MTNLEMRRLALAGLALVPMTGPAGCVTAAAQLQARPPPSRNPESRRIRSGTGGRLIRSCVVDYISR